MFETRNSVNMFVSHGIMESTLVFHHLLGIVLYALACLSHTYLYLSAVVLIQAAPPKPRPARLTRRRRSARPSRTWGGC